VSDNTLGRKRPALSRWFVFVDTESAGFSPAYVSRRQAASSIRYLSSRRRRALELLIASGLLVLLLPLMGMIAASVRIGSKGPVLFRQKRHGKEKAEFELLKFRSMYCSQSLDPGVTQATRDDPRVTSVGRVLRRTSLDELPQLWNVIKGDMSLIGPRPHAIEHDALYEQIIGRYSERFGAKPGITGLAQVSGARGATPRPEDMQCRIDLDIQYLQTASLALDCRILLSTVKEVIGSDAAY
jgi:lipopolysaccharide/colanic/teichoic acid biosynthesis glycosyltransferase